MSESVRKTEPIGAAQLVGRLLESIGGHASLDRYCADLAGLVEASAVSVFVAGRAGAMVSAGHAGAVAGAAETTLLPAETTERIVAGDASGEAPPGVHWSVLRAGDRLLGLQSVAWPDGMGSTEDRQAVDRISRLLARCVERSGVIDQLRRSDNVKTEFVRTVSHELRTPLNTVIGYTDLLVEEVFGPLASEQRKVLLRVGDRARGLLEVIAATLDLPGVDGGRVSLETQRVSLVDVLRELEADAREWRPRHDLEYRWDIPEELPAIHTDAGKVRVILKNLIANAVKFTDSGGITVRAGVRDDGVEISVEDTGIGIEPDAVHYVFGAFQQVSTVAPAGFGGVGLGLYIVRRLVALLNGRLRVESELGVGTTFHVWLPCQPGHRPRRTIREDETEGEKIQVSG